MQIQVTQFKWQLCSGRSVNFHEVRVSFPEETILRGGEELTFLDSDKVYLFWVLHKSNMEMEIINAWVGIMSNKITESKLMLLAEVM